MKSHRIESFIFTFSIVSLIFFLISLPFGFILGDSFLLIDLISRLFYVYGSFSICVILFIVWRRKKRGHKKPLSIEAMRNAKDELPDKVYKFCSLSTGNDKNLDKKKLDTLKTNNIWMTDCSVLNDPFEGQFAFIPEDIADSKSDIVKSIKKQLLHERDRYIQSSMSFGYDNILMWGHYANGCRGYCIEYSIQKKDHLFPVQYLPARLLLSSPKFSKEVYDNLKKIDLELKKLKNDDEWFTYMMYIQSIKSSVWSYEKEVRLIDIGYAQPNQKCGNVNCNMYGIKPSKIIIGYQCAYKNELIDIAKELNIPVSIMQISLDSKKYKLIEKSIKTS